LKEQEAQQKKIEDAKGNEEMTKYKLGYYRYLRKELKSVINITKINVEKLLNKNLFPWLEPNHKLKIVKQLQNLFVLSLIHNIGVLRPDEFRTMSIYKTEEQKNENETTNCYVIDTNTLYISDHKNSTASGHRIIRINEISYLQNKNVLREIAENIYTSEIHLAISINTRKNTSMYSKSDKVGLRICNLFPDFPKLTYYDFRYAMSSEFINTKSESEQKELAKIQGHSWETMNKYYFKGVDVEG
jgi:hypothetical protein